MVDRKVKKYILARTENCRYFSQNLDLQLIHFFLLCCFYKLVNWLW